MAHPTSTDPSLRRSAWPRRLALAVVVGLFILLALYATAPYLAKPAAQILAQRLGLHSLQWTVERPRWHALTIRQFHAVTDDAVVNGENVHLTFTWSGLLDGQLNRIAIDRLDIALSASDPQSSTEAPALDAWLGNRPFAQLTVAQLSVRFPQTGFVGHGQARLGDDGLHIQLDGMEPEQASRLRASVSLTSQGNFDARLGDQQADDAHFLTLRGQLQNAAMVLHGQVDLSGYPLQLVSEIASLPQGTGSITGEFHTRLSWPLPDNIAWAQTDVTIPAFAVNWASADERVVLRDLAGTASLTTGRLSATATGSARYRVGDGWIGATLPANYTLHYDRETLQGPAGLRVDVELPEVTANARMHAFTLQTMPPHNIHASADVTITASDALASGTIAGSLEGAALNVNADLQVTGGPAADRSPLLTGAGRLRAQVAMHMPSPIPPVLLWRELSADVTSFDVDWQSSNRQLAAKKISGSATLAQGAVAARLSGNVLLQQDTRKVTLTLPTNYALNFVQDTLRAGSGATVQFVDGATQARLRLRSAQLNLKDTNTLKLEADLAAQSDSVQTDGRLTGHARLWAAPKARAAGQLTYDGAMQTASGRREGTMRTTFSLHDDRLKADGTLSSGVIEQLPFILTHNIASGSGRLDATSTFDFREPVAASLAPNWSAPYDLDAGRVDATATLTWTSPDRIIADTLFALSDGRAHYATFRAAAVAGQFNLRASNALDASTWRLLPTRITIGRVTTGTPLENVDIGLAWSGDRVAIAASHADVLGGRATTAPFDYMISTGSAAFDVAVEGISVEEVLALEGDDIKGNGTLDGTLPVSMTDNTPRVDGGVLHARPPGGTIRLTPKVGAAAGKSQFGFALVALENFTYTVLRADIDYAGNGDLRLGVHLQGRNPAVQNGRPIHYNLNITENVPVLLESLRLQDKLTERIENKVKK